MLSRLTRGCVLAVIGAVVLHQVVARPRAQSAPDALKFFKNYFLTGDYVVGGIGLRGGGAGTGIASGQISISGVPEDADVVAAFLYWQVVNKETDGPEAGAVGVAFNGYQLSTPDGPVGRVLDQVGTSPCWSSGGGTGSSGGVHKTYSYRADVLRFFAYDETTGKPVVNGSHTISIPDGGNQVPSALGASLVVIFRQSSLPLSAIVLYDDGFTVDNATRTVTQTIKGFYQPAAMPNAKATVIAGSGQSNKNELLIVNGTTHSSPFGSFNGADWDTVTVPVNFGSNPSAVSQFDVTIDTQNVSASDCITPVGILVKTHVLDTDGDGLLDIWETSPTPLLDPQGNALPLLSAMQADPNRKDVYIEVGYMDTEATTYGGVAKPAHTHLPDHETLKLFGDAFKNAPGGPIAVHLDLGPDYPMGDLTDPSKNADEYILRGAGLARGGERVSEQATVCERGPTDPAWVCQFSDYPGTVGWKTGFRYLKDEVTAVVPPEGMPAPPPGEEFCDTPGYRCERRFDRERKDMFKYVFFAHAIGLPKSEEPCQDVLGVPTPAGSTGQCAAPLVDNPDFHVPRTNTGVGDFPGGDAMITLGAFADLSGRPVGTPFMQASTLLHEVGHLGLLRHGSVAFAPNCQPLYLSAMNYLYQLRGLLDDFGTPHLDFSRMAASSPLDETFLSDGVSGPGTYRIGWYAPLAGSVFEGNATAAARHCDGTPIQPGETPMVRVDAYTAASAIDWKADAAFEAGFSLDINFNGRTSRVTDGSPEILGSSDDWAALLLTQTGARRNTGGLYLDVTGRLALGPLSLDTGRGDLGRGDLGRGDLGRGDLGRGDLGRGDLGRGDLGRGDLGRGDLGTLALGRGDLGRGDLGGGDLFQNDPNNPFGEMDYDAATDLARTPPNEFTACVTGVDCAAVNSPLHSVRVTFTASNVGNVASYIVYRVEGQGLFLDQDWIPVAQVDSVPAQVDYSALDDDELLNNTYYTYFAVAVYADGIRSDPSNLVTILGRNDPPVAVSDAYSTPEDTPLIVAAPGVLANDDDPDTDSTLTAIPVGGPSHGTLTLNADGSYVYTPSTNFHGVDSFTYKATDGTVETNVVTVEITVTSVNDAPSAAADAYSTRAGTPLVVAAPGVLGNDSDLEGPLSAALVTGPAHGALTLNADGSFTYTPAGGFYGSDSFVYAASDGLAAAQATVTIAVEGPLYGFVGVLNLPPSSNKSFNPGSAVPLQWRFTVNGAVVNSIDAMPEIVVVNASGVVVYLGNPDDPGSSSFQPPTAGNGFTWQFNWQTKGVRSGSYQVFVGSRASGQTFAATAAFGPFAVRLK